MPGYTTSSQGTPPSRRTALKALGGAVASGGTALAVTGTATPVAADGGRRPGRIPRDLRPGGALDRLAEDLAAKDEFSGSLLVTYGGRTTLSRSHGMANEATGVRNGPETRFGLASVTKMFTAAAIHQLVEQNKVNYNDKLGDHLDGFAAEIADTVTIHHLFTHSSGLGDFHDLPGYREESLTWDSAEEVLNGTVEYIRGQKLKFPPGAGNQYSNSAYCLLGAIVDARSGRPYYDHMAARVFKDAGMHRSGFFTKPQWRTDPSIAHPYYKKPGSSEWTDSLEEHPYIALPAGDSFATCADLERFAHALLDNDLMDAPYTELMLGAKIPLSPRRPPPDGPKPSAPPPPSDDIVFAGYGSLTSLSNGQWSYGHNGGSPLGASTNLAIFPGSGWVVVVLGNHGDRTSDPIVRLARRLILEQ